MYVRGYALCVRVFAWYRAAHAPSDRQSAWSGCLSGSQLCWECTCVCVCVFVYIVISMSVYMLGSVRRCVSTFGSCLYL